MSSASSVTGWIEKLRAGDHTAAQLLWERYFQRLVGLARTRLRGASRRAQDEQDVAVAAFASFCEGAEKGRFPKLTDRDSLWNLLFAIVVHKAGHLVRYEQAQKRGGGQVVGEDALEDLLASDNARGIDRVVGNEPSPEIVVELTDQWQRLLHRLGDDTLRQVAIYKMEGYTNDEIADKLDCSEVTIRRKLDAIRRIWAWEEDER
jgi:DNA-directed RNA polymerase specialized sigma24 family protein